MLRSACLCLALISCATPYQSTGSSGGYSEVQVGENVFRVTFEGNSSTAPDRVSDYALLRSADLTLERGFRFFVVANDATATTVSGGGKGGVASSPTVIETIVCYRAKPADATSLVYEAQSVSKALHAKYKVEEAAQRKTVPYPTHQVCQGDSECNGGGSCIEGICRQL